jgi:aspartyl-tRNA(Asn)/glutamyl-tRNA(Gln) amidotransferase subunit A
VPTDGVVPLSRTLDHVGPLASTVSDAYVVYRALVGDFSPRPLVAPPVAGMSLGILRRYFCDALDDEVRTAFEATVERLRAAGARVQDVDVRHAGDIVPIYLHIMLPDAAAYHAKTLDACGEKYTAPVRVRLEMGRHVLAEDYIRAMAGRAVLQREVDGAVANHDALVLPTMPIAAPPIGADTVRVGSVQEPVRNLMLRNTQLFNVTGHPAISLPAGRTSGGLPCAVQLVGPRMRTEALGCVALACESILDHGHG